MDAAAELARMAETARQQSAGSHEPAPAGWPKQTSSATRAQRSTTSRKPRAAGRGPSSRKVQPELKMISHIVVVIVGIPGSGKSNLAHAIINDAATSTVPRRWRRISQDVLGSCRDCVSAAQDALHSGEHPLIDRCNFDAKQRAHWIRLTQDPHTYRVAIWLDIPLKEALDRVCRRPPHEGGVDSNSKSLEDLRMIVSRMRHSLRPPSLREGFDEVHRCWFRDPNALPHVRKRLLTLLHEAEQGQDAVQGTVRLPSQSSGFGNRNQPVIELT